MPIIEHDMKEWTELAIRRCQSREGSVKSAHMWSVQCTLSYKVFNERIRLFEIHDDVNR